MKTKNLLLTVFTCLSVGLLSACSSSDDKIDLGEKELGAVQLLKLSDEGITTFNLDEICPILSATDELTADEIEFLYAVREDEKVARDMAIYFSILYPNNYFFANKSAAESNHVASIERVLNYYEIEFPELGEAGIFEDAERQAYYDRLIDRGSTLSDALQAVAQNEEESYFAYKKVLSSSSNPNIKIIIKNLKISSLNHLKASVRQITRLGDTYFPILLNEEEYNDLIGSNFDQGGKHHHQGDKNHHTNSEKGHNGKGHKGSVNNNGHCTGSSNGSHSGSGKGKGHVGKGYRGGR